MVLVAVLLILLTASSATSPLGGPQPLSRPQLNEAQEAMPELGVFDAQTPPPQPSSPPLGGGASFGP